MGCHGWSIVPRNRLFPENVQTETATAQPLRDAINWQQLLQTLLDNLISGKWVSNSISIGENCHL